MARYIGLDVHDASCTMAVVGTSGIKLAVHVVETNAKLLTDLLKTIARPRYLIFEEGTHSAWLYETLAPHVDETVVTAKQKTRGNKGDERDALQLAERLRTNAVETRVYKGLGRYGCLRELTRVHRMQVRDSVRVRNRISALFRSRGIMAYAGVFKRSTREEGIAKLPARTQSSANLLLEELDSVESLRQEAEATMIAEASKHSAFKLLQSVPGIGPISAAYLMAIVVTPERFRTRAQFWSYAGMAIVMRSSSDWVRTSSGKWQRAEVQQTRGLNPNHNAVLKSVFKGAATTVITRGRAESPLRQHYDAMLENNIKPNLAKLTLARQIAAITLAVWKKERPFDAAQLKKHS